MSAINTAEGRELRRIGPEAVAAKYPNISNYHPTNTQFRAPFRSARTLHFQLRPHGHHSRQPERTHAVWIDTRSGKASVLYATGETLSGELQRVVPVSGARPSNVAQFRNADGRFKNYIAIASLSGLILILDGDDRVVSVVGGELPFYADGKLPPLQVFNYAFNHPHDVYMDTSGALYVPQWWWSNQTYPLKLELVGGK